MGSKRPVEQPVDSQGDADRLAHERAQASALLQTLSPREREVLALVITGITAKAIGAELGIKEPTVKAHLTNLYRKLRVANRVQATHFYLLAQAQSHEIDSPTRL